MQTTSVTDGRFTGVVGVVIVVVVVGEPLVSVAVHVPDWLELLDQLPDIVVPLPDTVPVNVATYPGLGGRLGTSFPR